MSQSSGKWIGAMPEALLEMVVGECLLGKVKISSQYENDHASHFVSTFSEIRIHQVIHRSTEFILMGIDNSM